MIRLHGGPCEGTYAVKRAPIYLRAVRLTTATDPKPGDGLDVLDQLADVPRPRETVHVYRKRPGTGGHVHLNTGRSRGSGFYALGEYDHMPEVDGELLRTTADWRTWAALQPAPDDAYIEEDA